MSSVQLSTLSNKLRVVTDPLTSVETVTLGMWVNVGSRYETYEENGISHVLEHMAFRGTKSHSSQEISEKIEAVGGYLNAYTSRETTAYYARVLKKDVELALSLLADILQYSTFEEQEIAREKAVILQEINQIQDTPDDLIFDHLFEAAYSHQPYGRPIAGRNEVVSSINQQSLKTYMKRHYHADNMIFAASGNIDHLQISDLVQIHFKDLTHDASPHFEKATYQGGEHQLEKSLEQIHVALGFEGVTYSDTDYHAASILSTILGGGMSSRLFQEVREKRGLAYGISSFSMSSYDTGLFGIYTSTSPDHGADILPVICDEILKITSSIHEHELKRAKNQVKASLLMALEGTSSRCRQIAMQTFIYGNPLSLQTIVDKIDNVTIGDVINVGKKIFLSQPTLSVIGPAKSLISYESILQHLKN